MGRAAEGTSYVRMAWCIFALILVTAVAVPAALAQAIARHPNGDVLRLTQKPCKNVKVIAHVPAEYRPVMKAGSAVISGKGYPICWMLNPRLEVVAVYEDGAAGVVPATEFGKDAVGF
jgi:hypothetical protein